MTTTIPKHCIRPTGPNNEYVCKKQRVSFTIEIDLDPVPGAFHDINDMRERLERMIQQQIPHYHPEVR